MGLGGIPGFLGDPAGLRLVYVPTASKPMKDRSYAEHCRAALAEMGFDLDDLEIDEVEQGRMQSALDSADAVLVEGGSPFWLLQAMRETGFDRIVVDAVRAGLPYIGISAGALVAGPDVAPLSAVSNTSLAPRLRSTEALGLADYVVYPHYDSPERSEGFPKLLAEFGERFRLLPLTDTQALVVDDGTAKIVESG
jgi:dipeptidase E